MDDAEKNRRDVIVEAALQVFADKGFHKASIKQIAKAAGLKSPSLIYWYFKDKDELLRAVITALAPIFEQITHAENMLDLPPEVVLPIMIKAYFDVFTNPTALRMIKIFLSEGIVSPEAVKPLTDNAQQVLHFFMAYLGRQIELGRLRPHDIQVSTRAFVGMLLVYMLTREIMQPLGEGLPETEQYGEEVISIFLGGLRP